MSNECNIRTVCPYYVHDAARKSALGQKHWIWDHNNLICATHLVGFSLCLPCLYSVPAIMTLTYARFRAWVALTLASACFFSGSIICMGNGCRTVFQISTQEAFVFRPGVWWCLMAMVLVCETIDFQLILDINPVPLRKSSQRRAFWRQRAMWGDVKWYEVVVVKDVDQTQIIHYYTPFESFWLLKLLHFELGVETVMATVLFLFSIPVFMHITACERVRKFHARDGFR